MKALQHFKKVSDYHKLVNLPAPEHPLISLVDYSKVRYPSTIETLKWKQDYYTIGLKRNVRHKLFYGQKEYDFDEGIMTFVAPNQIMSLGNNPNIKTQKSSGWLLLIHPDFLWNTPLAKQIKRYEFFGYNITEALFLSEKEELMMLELLKNMKREYQSTIDKFSQKIIITQIELLLNYAERYYERQFITRNIPNNQILNQLELVLSDYFNHNKVLEKDSLNVQKIAEKLNLSPNYLSGILKALTGQSTQQHIQNALIEKAKEQLSTTYLSVSEIAYNLGFEYPASFSKVFKNKTNMSPLEFRKTFN